MSTNKQKLYSVTFDGQPDFILAYDFGGAIRVWRSKLIRENEPGDFDESIEPESVELVSDEGVTGIVDQGACPACGACLLAIDPFQAQPDRADLVRLAAASLAGHRANPEDGWGEDADKMAIHARGDAVATLAEIKKGLVDPC